MPSYCYRVSLPHRLHQDVLRLPVKVSQNLPPPLNCSCHCHGDRKSNQYNEFGLDLFQVQRQSDERELTDSVFPTLKRHYPMSS